MSSASLLDEVNAYYTHKVRTYGATPQGVDWNSAASQEIRFAQLLRLVEHDGTIGDYGCGYGALHGYLRRRGYRHDYRGYDISADMLTEAKRLIGNAPHATFHDRVETLAGCEYIVASGIFNVRLQQSLTDWKQYIIETIHELADLASRGFAFNCLTSYSDADRMRQDLYYADPCELFDFCKRRFSRNVALLHDYGLYEFTLIVRK
jgi:SAM-dependent methyltransferase